MKNAVNILYLFFVIFIQGCATSANNADDGEKPGKLLVMKQLEVATLAYAIEFEMNDIKRTVGAGDVVPINLRKEGIYGITKTGIFSPFDSKSNLINDPEFINEKSPIYFKYSKGQVIHIRLATKAPAEVITYDSSGKIVSKGSLKREKAMHLVNAYPNNVTVMVLRDDGTRRTIHDNTKSTNWNATTSFKLELDALFDEPRNVKTIVRWEDFDYEIEYEAQLIKGVTTQMNISPSASLKFLQWKSNTLAGQERINFICKNELNTVHKEYDKCLEHEKLAQLELERVQKEAALLREVEENLATREGVECKPKLNGKSPDRHSTFLACVSDAVRKKNAAIKFAEALKSEEGGFCNKTIKQDGEAFWKCYEERISVTKTIKADEVASQCVSIGFEYASSSYKDCYLKLKIHTEQISEWKRLQESLKKQADNKQSIVIQQSQSTSTDDSARYLDIAQRAFGSVGGGVVAPSPSLPPPPVRLVTPMGNSYNCSMMGAALRCR